MFIKSRTRESKEKAKNKFSNYDSHIYQGVSQGTFRHQTSYLHNQQFTLPQPSINQISNLQTPLPQFSTQHNTTLPTSSNNRPGNFLGIKLPQIKNIPKQKHNTSTSGLVYIDEDEIYSSEMR